MRLASTPAFNTSAGMSLFELVVVICLVAILYVTLSARLSDLPAEAERVNFQTVLGQLKTTLSFELLRQKFAEESNQSNNYHDSNPMNFLLETPDNYQGVLEQVTDENAKRGSWYFENSTKQLVYVVNKRNLDHVFVSLSGIMVNFGQIRLKVVNVYREAVVIEDVNKILEGIVLEPVHPFQWESEPIVLTNLTLTSTN